MAKRKSFVFGIFFVVVILIIAPASIVAYFEIKYANSFYLGINIAGESVEGKNYAEVLKHFTKKADLINKNGLTFNIKTKKGVTPIQVPEFSQGLTTDKVAEHFSLDDWENTIKNAYNIGRTGDFWQRAKEQYNSFVKKPNFVFSPIIQKDAVYSFLSDSLDENLTKSQPAEFVVKNNALFIKPEVVGEKIDSEKVADVLAKNLSLFDNSTINLQTINENPEVTQNNLSKFLDFAEKIKNNIKINFTYNGNSWKVGGSTLATWLTIKDKQIGVDDKKLEEYFNKTVILYIDSPMQNSRFQMKEGKLTEISVGKTGNVVDVEKNSKKINSAILSLLNSSEINFETIHIIIETTQEEPKVTKETINKYKIKELVGTATTNFAGGSLDRQHNIEVGVSKLNGILLAPGEEFSALNAIGEVSAEAGFVEEYVINNGKTQKEVGGGLCQIATTLFRLALDSGLPIVERINHRYVISYYGAGLDATIYAPHPDLRFINDTGNYLLLQGRAQNNEVVLEFYGKQDGRTVAISEPKTYDIVVPPPTKYIPSTDVAVGQTKCSEIPHNGITADATYTVTYPTGEVKETNFRSVYQPWQKVCYIGVAKE